MKRLVAITCACILGVSAFVGCGNKAPETTKVEKQETKKEEPKKETAKTEPTDIRFQIVWDVNSGRGQNIQSVVDAFNKSQQDVSVSLITGTSDDKQLITSLLSDDAPEVIQMSVKNTKTIGVEGLLRELNDFEGSYKEIFYPELVEFFKYDGALYGAPWIGHTIELVYNKDLLTAAGLDKAPETWEEVMEYSKVIEEKTDATGLGIAGMQNNDAIWMSTPIIMSYGGKFIDTKDGKEVMAINTPEGIKGLSMYQQFANMYPGAAEKNGGNVMEDFRNGKIAMEFQGPWGITDIWKNGNPFVVDATVMPAGPAGRFVDGGPYALSIPATLEGEKYDAALAFMNYLQDTSAQEMIMDGEYDEKTDAYYPYRVPMRKDMAASKYFEENPQFLVYVQGLEHVIDSFPTPGFNQVANEVITVELNKLASGATTPEEAAKVIEEKGNEILRAFYGD